MTENGLDKGNPLAQKRRKKGCFLVFFQLFLLPCFKVNPCFIKKNTKGGGTWIFFVKKTFLACFKRNFFLKNAKKCKKVTKNFYVYQILFKFRGIFSQNTLVEIIRNLKPFLNLRFKIDVYFWMSQKF